ncbi:TRAP transporter small permease [Salibacterium halotolerans]|uniref:TRAP-type C4-dicarboxylate transport system, small permease component n=1 Tax=Salibacterium halotolerans TaxID=1884432 RepID=A0A1I5KXK3_9BACI|nr:TRAP transporter small permease [Salibacterium halotolerans]SFO89642.1 TRAP-type C4-dicarboxylate transport system, small permease component [Salibacterium halotolerans]
MSVLKTINESIEEWLLTLFLSIAVASISVQIFMRFFLNSSLSWSEELARYCFIWLIYIAIAYGAKKARHITFDTLYDSLPDKGKKIMDVVAQILFGLFACLMVYYGLSVMQTILSYGQTSPALGINMALVYSAVPVGMFLTVIRLIQNLYNSIKY